jgi:hypothetical protein
VQFLCGKNPKLKIGRLPRILGLGLLDQAMLFRGPLGPWNNIRCRRLQNKRSLARLLLLLCCQGCDASHRRRPRGVPPPTPPPAPAMASPSSSRHHAPLPLSAREARRPPSPPQRFVLLPATPATPAPSHGGCSTECPPATP